MWHGRHSWIGSAPTKESGRKRREPRSGAEVIPFRPGWNPDEGVGAPNYEGCNRRLFFRPPGRGEGAVLTKESVANIKPAGKEKMNGRGPFKLES